MEDTRAEYEALVHAQVTDALERLSHDVRSTAGIANRLHELGIQGSVCEPGHCPVSTYLRRELRLNVVTLGDGSIVVDGDGATAVTIHEPRWLTQFVLNFDLGAYPDLIRKGDNVDSWRSGDLQGPGGELPGCDRG